MHLAYSAVNNINNNPQPNKNEKDNELMLRYEAYQLTCSKYSSEIAAIQKYIPGWVPKLNR